MMRHKLLFGREVLGKYLDAMLGFELPDKPRIPDTYRS